MLQKTIVQTTFMEEQQPTKNRGSTQRVTS